jgi:hypothetical protein
LCIGKERAEEDLAENSVEDEAVENPEEAPAEDCELPLSGLHAKL